MILNEEHWEKFADCFRDIPVDTELLCKLDNNIELAKVIEGVVGEVALEWVERKIPALHNGKPVNFLKDKKQLEKLKAMLMRMPS